MDAKSIQQDQHQAITSRDFNQDTARAKRIAMRHPVFIKTRGEVSHVLMTKAAFDQLSAVQKEVAPQRKWRSLADALAQPDGEDIEFEAPEFKEIRKGFEFD